MSRVEALPNCAQTCKRPLLMHVAVPKYLHVRMGCNSALRRSKNTQLTLHVCEQTNPFGDFPANTTTFTSHLLPDLLQELLWKHHGGVPELFLDRRHDLKFWRRDVDDSLHEMLLDLRNGHVQITIQHPLHDQNRWNCLNDQLVWLCKEFLFVEGRLQDLRNGHVHLKHLHLRAQLVSSTMFGCTRRLESIEQCCLPLREPISRASIVVTTDEELAASSGSVERCASQASPLSSSGTVVRSGAEPQKEPSRP